MLINHSFVHFVNFDQIAIKQLLSQVFAGKDYLWNFVLIQKAIIFHWYI